MRVTAVSHAKFPKVNLHGYITKNKRKARDIYRGKRGFRTPKVSEPITMLRLICTLIVYLKDFAPSRSLLVCDFSATNCGNGRISRNVVNIVQI